MPATRSCSAAAMPSFRMSRGTLDLELTDAVLAEQPAELRLLRIRNRSDEPRRLRVVAYAQIALAELADGHALDRHRRPGQARSLDAAVRQPRQRVPPRLGLHGLQPAVRGARDGALALLRRRRPRPHQPLLRRSIGGPDRGRPDDGFRCAALAGSLEVPAGGEALVSVVIGQAPHPCGRLGAGGDFSRSAGGRAGRGRDARPGGTTSCSVLRVETNLPAFDRLVNDWLPYQALTARLWGRAGPSQRSGAFGFRDQLQDVLAFLPAWPELARQQILLHASQQFVEGDVLKWWHVSWQGDTGAWRAHPRFGSASLAAATSSPATSVRRVTWPSSTSGRPFSKARRSPPGRDGMLVVPRPSLRECHPLGALPAARRAGAAATAASMAFRSWAPATGTTASTWSAAKGAARASGSASCSTACSGDSAAGREASTPHRRRTGPRRPACCGRRWRECGVATGSCARRWTMAASWDHGMR